MKIALFTLVAAALPAPLAAKPMRPVYHFAPARNWMNDPNGLLFFGGEYHMFYQYNPYGDQWGHISWGHAVSRDLVSWQELPVAIPEAGGVMAYSGSAVVDWSNSSGFGKDGKPPMIAIYTGSNMTAKLQSQYLAYSNDRGRTWTVHGEVLSIGSPEFRDPKVFWYQPTKRWVMIAVLATENRALIFTSVDLKSWTFASSFGPAGGHARYWECPDLFPLPVEGGAPGERRWVLTIGLSDSAIAGGSGGQYFVGDFDGTRFVPIGGEALAPRWTDYGADFYASVSYNDLPTADLRRVWIGWANDWAYANVIPTYPARGIMAVPREVTLHKINGEYRLFQTPVSELASRRRNGQQLHDVVLSARPSQLPISSRSAEIQIDLDTRSAKQIVFALSDGDGHQTLIGVNPAAGEAFLDRTRSGPHFHDDFEARHVAPIDVINGKVSLHILVDQSIIEVFVNGGARTITDRVFPTGQDFHWSVSAIGGSASLDLQTWRIVGEKGSSYKPSGNTELLERLK